MSNREDSNNSDGYVPHRTMFGSLIHPRLDTEQVNALQESVRNQKLERYKINKEGNELSVLQGKISEPIQKEIDDESGKMEIDEQMTNLNKNQDPDQLEEKMEDVGAHGKIDNLLKNDSIQEDDKIEEKVVNKQ